MMYLTHSQAPVNAGIVGVGVGVPVGVIEIDGLTVGVCVTVEVIVGVGVEPPVLVDGVNVGVGVTAGDEQQPVQIVVNVPPVKSTGITTESVNAQNVVENPTFSTTK